MSFDPIRRADAHAEELERRHREWLRTAHIVCDRCGENIFIGETLLLGLNGRYCSRECAIEAGERDAVERRLTADDIPA